LHPTKTRGLVGCSPVWCPGGLRPIESFAPGSDLLAYDFFMGSVTRTRVERLDVHQADLDLLKLMADPAAPLYVTPGHWFHTGDEWVLSEDLRFTGRVLTASAGRVGVSSHPPVRCWNHTVYNLNTRHGTYLVGRSGLVVSGVVEVSGTSGEGGLHARVLEESSLWKP
jgi:hypothetical protein